MEGAGARPPEERVEERRGEEGAAGEAAAAPRGASPTELRGRGFAPPARASSAERIFVGAAAAFVVLAGVASVALSLHYRRLVPPEAAWAEAAGYVRAGFGEGDLVGIAPWWADSARIALGPLPAVFPRDLAAEDFGAFRRLWLVAAYGEGEATGDRLAARFGEDAAARRRFGKVEVRRFALAPPAILYDFYDRLEAAEVEVRGLGASPLRCDRALPDGWGCPRPPRGSKAARAEVVRDLRVFGSDPRACIFAAPWQKGVLALTYRGVPLGLRIRVFGGIAAAGLQKLKRGDEDPVWLEVWAGGARRAELAFPPEPAWRSFDVDTAALAGRTADVEFRVRAKRVDWRFFGFRARAER